MLSQANIVTIGGGAGTFNVLYGLKKNLSYHLSAIISVADDGGTTGAIRDKYGILPPGDMRRAIAALAKNTERVRQLFEYSFKNEEGVIGSNKIGNILLTALVDIEKDFERALEVMCEMFDVRGRVIPVTLDNVHLAVKFEDGVVIVGEKNIDISDKNPGERSHNIDQNIVNAYLVNQQGEHIRSELNPRAAQAVIDADFVIIGPGDLFTSIVPNFLSSGMTQALQASRAKKIYVCNVMTKRGETTNMKVKDFIETIERYMMPAKLDYVIVNNGFIAADIVEKYKQAENKKPLKIENLGDFAAKNYQIIERDIVDDEDYVRHDPKKLARIIEDIINCRI